jgi:hypothetical protein
MTRNSFLFCAIRNAICEDFDFLRKFFARGGFPRPARNERGEGEGEGLAQQSRLLSPALSCVLRREEMESFGCGVSRAVSLVVGEQTSFFIVLFPVNGFN